MLAYTTRWLPTMTTDVDQSPLAGGGIAADPPTSCGADVAALTSRGSTASPSRSRILVIECPEPLFLKLESPSTHQAVASASSSPRRISTPESRRQLWMRSTSLLVICDDLNMFGNAHARFMLTLNRSRRRSWRAASRCVHPAVQQDRLTGHPAKSQAKSPTRAIASAFHPLPWGRGDCSVSHLKAARYPPRDPTRSLIVFRFAPRHAALDRRTT